MPQRRRIRFGRLLDWLEGRLPAAESNKVSEEVEVADDTTLADLGWLRLFDQIQASTALTSAPPALRQIVAQHFGPASRLRLSPTRLLVAALRFDSAAQPVAVAARAVAAPATTRQLLFTTDAVDIALNVHRRLRDVRLKLSGQVFPSATAEHDMFNIQLLRGVEEVARATTDDLGEFGFDAVPPGEYHMLLSADTLGIMITPLELRA